MAFDYFFADIDKRFWLGTDRDGGGYFLSIIVPTPMCDYEEIYSISPAQFAHFLTDSAAALAFAALCNRGQHEDCLIVSRYATLLNCSGARV